MSSITSTESKPVSLARDTNIEAYYFESNSNEIRPIFITTRSFIRAVDAEGFAISEWEATDNFSTNLTTAEAEVLVSNLIKAIAEARASGF